MYYVVTAAHYEEHKDQITQAVRYSLDNSKCIIELHGEYICNDYIEAFGHKSAINAWLWDPETNEIANWLVDELEA